MRCWKPGKIFQGEIVIKPTRSAKDSPKKPISRKQFNWVIVRQSSTRESGMGKVKLNEIKKAKKTNTRNNTRQKITCGYVKGYAQLDDLI